jgi:hypothetical protein
MKETLLDWFGTFWKVLISPTPQTFLQEVKKAEGKFASALAWLVFYAIYMVAMASLAIRDLLSVPTLLTVVCLIPLTVILFTSVINFICQRIFHRKEYIYDQLLYITVSVLLPVFIIFAPISAFVDANIFKILIFILLFYQAAVLTVGVKTVANIAYWQAFVTVVFSIIAGIVISGILYILILSTVSPPGLTQPK